MEPRISISIITLGVKDFDRDGLGFATKANPGDPIAFFQTAGTRLALYPLDKLAEDIGTDIHPSKSGFGGITLAHNARTKEDVARILALAEKAGGKIVKPAQDTFWGGHSGYFTDPDGYIWEVAWAPMFTFDEHGALIV